MKRDEFNTVYLKDYQEPDYLIEEVYLTFNLKRHDTEVLAESRVIKRKGVSGNPPLVLVGRAIVKLNFVKINNKLLEPAQFQCRDDQLVIPSPPGCFTLSISTQVDPAGNTSLEGLYFTGGNFCTQCEAQGFRRMTYFLDRPDVMAKYTTKIIADRQAFPVLLAGGNPVSQGQLDGDRHFAVWQDPFPKPSYLFALVAGNLVKIEDEFVTKSGRKVALRIYVEEANRNHCQFAMKAIQDAMAWDERRFGLEYDLDIFMVVAVSDFNMGAMENKGLNVFNAKYILADPTMATDRDFDNIQAVVGHEYFHNWTGNRVTCRDWFQLSLKEGLTVYRDQEFSSDMTSAALVRIKEVADLRLTQFSEDRSNMAHPVRPESYIEINNFYTATIYQKGAEVIRMLATILGRDGFLRGMNLYFERHDGQAVTTDDFVAAMADANAVDLQQFKLWYSQAGTPTVTWRSGYDEQKATLTLTLTQNTPDTPHQTNKKPLVIPIRLALMGPDGSEWQTEYQGQMAQEHLILLDDREVVVSLKGVKAKPVVSLLRSFSAPVHLKGGQSLDDLYFLMRWDRDDFNRYDACQKAAFAAIKALASDHNATLKPGYVEAWSAVLADENLGPHVKARCLEWPVMNLLLPDLTDFTLDQIFVARQKAQQILAEELAPQLLKTYHNHDDQIGMRTQEAVGRRALKNVMLEYMACLPNHLHLGLVSAQFDRFDNMTDTLAALTILVALDHSERERALASFYSQWHHQKLVIDKWFACQAGSFHPQVADHVAMLVEHEDYDALNPNRVYAVFRSYSIANPLGFHRPDGSGYQFVAEHVLKADRYNSAVAAHLAVPLGRWHGMDPPRQKLMKEALALIAAKENLSRDVYEIVSKGLALDRA